MELVTTLDELARFFEIAAHHRADPAAVQQDRLAVFVTDLFEYRVRRFPHFFGLARAASNMERASV